MTQRQAVAKAKKLWGSDGNACEMLGPIFNKFKVGLFKDALSGGVEEVKGIGQSWDKAFMDADRGKIDDKRAEG